jgi:hypothetical protein
MFRRLIPIILGLVVSTSAFAELCDIITVASNQETVVATKALSGRSNPGTVAGFTYNITSLPGALNIELTNPSGQTVNVSGPANPPLIAPAVDENGNGVKIRCYLAN